MWIQTSGVSPAFLLFPCLPVSALVALGSEPSPLKQLTAPDKEGGCTGAAVSGRGQEGGRGSRPELYLVGLEQQAAALLPTLWGTSRQKSKTHEGRKKL